MATGRRRAREADAGGGRLRVAPKRAPRVRDDALLFELVAARFPEVAQPSHREICSRLRWCPPLVAAAADRGALLGYIAKADALQAVALRRALEASGGARIRPARWTAAIKVAIRKHSAPALEALLEACRGGDYAALELEEDDWMVATWGGGGQQALRALLVDGRVDPRAALPAAIGRPDALAMVLSDPRVDGTAVDEALALACAAVAQWVRSGSMCGHSWERQSASRARPFEALHAVLEHPLVDATAANHAALGAAAAAGGASDLRRVLARDSLLPAGAVAAALCAAAGRVGPEWDDSPAFKRHASLTEDGDDCWGDRRLPPGPLVAARYDGEVLAALAALPQCSADAAAVALEAAARVWNRDAVLLLMRRAGGPAAVPGALRCLVLGVIARIPPPGKLQFEVHSYEPWLPALCDASPEAEAADWAEDAPLVSALLGAPGFDPHAEGGGVGLLARAVEAGRLGCVRCLLADARMAVQVLPHLADAPMDARAVKALLRVDLLAVAVAAGRPAVTAALLTCPRLPRTHVGLAAAARVGLMPVVEELLAAGVVPSPLAMHMAASGGSCAALAALMRAGGDPVLPMAAGDSALRAAVSARRPAAVRLLLSLEAVVAAEAPSSSAVALAVRELQFADVDEQPLSFEVLNALIAEPRFSACRGFDVDDCQLSDRVVACIMSAPSFDPADPSVVDAVVASAGFARQRRLRQLLGDPRVDPSARGNAALAEACLWFSRSLCGSDAAPDWACEWEHPVCESTRVREDNVLNTLDVLLGDARVVELGVERALAVAAAAGSHRIVRRLLQAQVGNSGAGASAALVAAAGSLHSELVNFILENGGGDAAALTDALRAAYATYHAQERRRSQQRMLPPGAYMSSVEPDLYLAYDTVVTRLLRDPRANPAAVADDFPEYAREWAVAWGINSLERAAKACPEVLRGREMHIARLDACRYSTCRRTNDLAVDFLLSRVLTDRDLDSVFGDRTWFDECINEECTLACVRRAVRRGNIPARVVCRLAAAEAAYSRCGGLADVLVDVVSARHDSAYASCGALPLDRWREHVAGGSCSAVTGGDWCDLQPCSSYVGPSAWYNHCVAAGPPHTSHCPGRCCDGGEAMLECVSALLALPHINPAFHRSSVLLAAVANPHAPPGVLGLLLRDGRADPRDCPALLETACSRVPPSPEIFAALLEDPRAVVTPGALVAAMRAPGFDFLGQLLRRQSASQRSLGAASAMPAAASDGENSGETLDTAAGPTLVQSALASAAGLGLSSTVRQLLSGGGADAASTDDIRLALGAAASAGHAHCALLLLRAGCDGRSDDTSRAGFDAGAALERAAAGGHAEVIRTLLRACHACPGHHSNGAFVAALSAAATRGRAEAVRVLIEAAPTGMRLSSDEEPHAPDDPAPPLLQAALHGHTEVLRVLLGEPRCITNLETAAVAAATGGHTEALRLLLAAASSASLSQCCTAAFTAAIGAAHAAAVRTILSAWDDAPGAALAAAALRICSSTSPTTGSAACMRVITAASTRSCVDALTADDCAAFRSLCGLTGVLPWQRQEHAELVAAVLELGADEQPWEGRNGAMSSVPDAPRTRSGKSRGGSVDPTARDCGALRAAAAAGNAEVVRLLLADPRIASDSAADARAAALVCAAQHDGCEAVVWLLAPRVADAGALLDAAEARVRRGDVETLRGILANIDPAAARVAVARRVQALSLAAPARVPGSHILRSRVDQAVDAWLAGRPGITGQGRGGGQGPGRPGCSTPPSSM